MTVLDHIHRADGIVTFDNLLLQTSGKRVGISTPLPPTALHAGGLALSTLPTLLSVHIKTVFWYSLFNNKRFPYSWMLLSGGTRSSGPRSTLNVTLIQRTN